MRSLGTRRVAMAAGVATVAVIGLAGCSAGQVAETAILQPAVSGINTQTPDGSLLVRNLQVVYNNPDGYDSGSTAPLEVSLFNQTDSPLTVLLSSTAPQAAPEGQTVVTARQIGVTGGAAGASAAPSAAASQPSASASEPVPSESEPATPALQPARFTIAPHSSQGFMPGDPQQLRAADLSGKLVTGTALAVTIESSASSQPLELLAPVSIPLSPAPRAPGASDESEEGGN